MIFLAGLASVWIALSAHLADGAPHVAARDTEMAKGSPVEPKWLPRVAGYQEEGDIAINMDNKRYKNPRTAGAPDDAAAGGPPDNCDEGGECDCSQMDKNSDEYFQCITNPNCEHCWVGGSTSSSTASKSTPTTLSSTSSSETSYSSANSTESTTTTDETTATDTYTTSGSEAVQTVVTTASASELTTSGESLAVVVVTRTTMVTVPLTESATPSGESSAAAF